MKNYNIYILLFLSILCFNACEECEEVFPTISGNSVDSDFCGWTVSTFYGGMADPSNANKILQDPDASVGILYDTRQNQSAPTGGDWSSTINKLEPTAWTVSNIGQVFGVAMDRDDNIFLASSDIYALNNWAGKSLESGNNNRPISCSQIYKCLPPNYIPEPFVNLPSSCDPLNGIGNIAYDYVNDQLFASNLEDGKIYRINNLGEIQDSYDPWLPDNFAAGIAPIEERVWGIGINVEEGVSKIYFAKSVLSSFEMYSLELEDGMFPTQGSERLVLNLPGNGAKNYTMISDLAFSQDGSTMVYAEYGVINQSHVKSLTNANGTWSPSGSQYYVGANVGIDGANTAGGVDFGPINSGAESSADCDQLIWATGKNLKANAVVGDVVGLQAFDVVGNGSFNSSSPTSNSATDIFIDLDGLYVDPCALSSSLILNAGFEELVNPNNPPNSVSQLDRAESWEQATQATSDFFYVPSYNGEGFFDITPPTNGSNGYAGAIIDLSGNYVEYIGACLSAPIIANTQHSFSILVGSPAAGTYNFDVMDLDLVLLGIPTCSFPISGIECKEGQYTELARIPLNVAESTWENVETTFTPSANFDAIMFSLSCNTPNPMFDKYYLLVDDIIINQGEPCSGMEEITDYPGDVELFKCAGCAGPKSLTSFIN